MEIEFETLITETSNYVFNKLGAFLLESVYQKGLKKILEKQGIDVSTEISIPLKIDDIYIDNANLRIDMIVNYNNNKYIIENKSISKLTIEHEYQLTRYLKHTNIQYGFLINYPKLKNINDELKCEIKMIKLI
jgi:GxxExxY protein